MASSASRSYRNRTALALAIALLSAMGLVRCSLLASESDYSRGREPSSAAEGGEGGAEAGGDAFVSALSFPRVFLLGGTIATTPTDLERAPFAVWSAGFDPDGRLVDWRQHSYATANSNAWSARVVSSNLALVGAVGDAGVFFMHAPIGPEGLGAFRDEKLFPIMAQFQTDPALSLAFPYVWADDSLVALGGMFVGAGGRPTLAKRIAATELMSSAFKPGVLKDAGPGTLRQHLSPTLLAHAGSIYVIGAGVGFLEVLRFDSDAGVRDVRSIQLGTTGGGGACLVGSEQMIYTAGAFDDARTVKMIALEGTVAQNGAKLVRPTYWPACFIHGSRLYAAGGSRDGGPSPESDIESVRLRPDGTLDGQWEIFGALPVAMMRGTAVVVESLPPPPATDR